LNPAQRQAVTHPGGPLLIIAGAGTGKTNTLACRVAWLVEQGVGPQRICLLTFTRRAAAEMLARAGRYIGRSVGNAVWGGTFHAVGNRLLRQYGRAVGLAPQFTVMDQGDAADLMNLIRSDKGFGQGKKRFPQKGVLVSIYSRVINSRTPLAQVLERAYPWCQDAAEGIRQIFDEYTLRKRQQLVLDYDDLLLYWHALCHHAQGGPHVAGLFDHILVDEYQDTNLLQAQILQAMRPQSMGQGNITVVGDDAQSIYAFRAATIRNILDFPRQFSGAAVVKLEQNYRSTQPILEASNAVMSCAKERYTKDLFTAREGGGRPALVTCFDETDQAEEVCRRVLESREEGTALREQAVLFRASHHADVLEVELARRNIPFVKYGGLKFVEAAHVKDLLAMLRLLENPADTMAWFRVLQLIEGIGPASARRIMDQLGLGGTSGAGSAVHRLVSGSVAAQSVPVAAREQFQQLRATLADCAGVPLGDSEKVFDRAGEAGVGSELCLTADHGPGHRAGDEAEVKNTGRAEDLPLAAQVERIRRFYEPLFERIYDNAAIRLRDLDQLEQIAGRCRSRQQFLADLALDPPNSTQDLAGPPLLDEDYLILSTVHSAKGCEWDDVHIIHAADGMIPSDMATGRDDEIEEERRLLYVAMTRARDALHVYFPLRYYHKGRGLTDRHTFAQVSRFLAPVVEGRFDRQTTAAVSAAGETAPDPLVAADPAAGTQAVDALISGLW
jgi:DNA helicase-2/ATP-dependent DNA helicase PcrA